MASNSISIPPFTLDHVEKCLWQGKQRIGLTPKDHAVLRCLVERAPQLVTHDELLRAGWPKEVVEPGALKVRLRRLRRLLGDTADTPRFIEAVRGHGYRFIGRVVPDVHAMVPSVVGREVELAELRRLLDSAAGGDRQMVLVTGEPGIGKTTLLDAFLLGLEHTPVPGLRTAHGQCIEHHGIGEAYLPILEALARLCRGPTGPTLVALLRRVAPTWLAQLPVPIEVHERETLALTVLGAGQERMMREMAEALEAFTLEQPLVLWLEDLQWADYSTLDLLRYLAQRRGLARLLLLGTCRDRELGDDHPLRALRQVLGPRRQVSEIPLRLLEADEVDAYLATRCSPWRDETERGALAARVHQASEGNPLFMVNVVDELLAQGQLVHDADRWRLTVPLATLELAVPDGLRQLILRQVARCASDEQALLEAAAVVGVEFATAAVAAALERDERWVEQRCEQLAREGRLLRAASVQALPDGGLTGRYRYVHALYQTVLYARQPPARRARSHRHIAAWGERAYGERSNEIAAELAMHFELGEVPARAVHHLAEAAHNALRRSANREAIDLLTRALSLLLRLPADTARAQRELELQVSLAVPLMMTRGSTALEVRTAYRRARDLCRELGDTPLLFPVLVGLGRFSYGWNLSDDSQALRAQLLRIAEGTADDSHMVVAQMMLSGNAFFQGRFRRALAHAEQGLARYDPRRHRALIYLYGDDPQVLCLCWAALAEWYLGRADSARTLIAEALDKAEHLSHPYGVVFAHFWSAFIHQGCGAPDRVLTHTTALLALTETHENPQFAAMGGILHAWARAYVEQDRDACARLRLGLDALRATRQELGRPYFLALLADLLRRDGRASEALAALTEALEIIGTTGECMHHAELLGLRGELLVESEAPLRERHALAEASFAEALDVCRAQSARTLEVRALTRLVRLHATALGAPVRGQAATTRLAEALGALETVLDDLPEGQDTAHVSAARALCEDLARGALGSRRAR